MVIVTWIIAADTLQAILMVQILRDWVEIRRMHRRSHVQIVRRRGVR